MRRGGGSPRLVLLFSGQVHIFHLLGITLLLAFKMASSSIVLLLIALDMLRARRSDVQGDRGGDTRWNADKADIAVTPLGVPMLAGPGAISTALLLRGKAEGMAQHVALLLSIGAACLASYLVLRFAARASRWIGPIGLKIAARLMGLLLAAVAFQFMIDALRDLKLAPAGREVSPKSVHAAPGSRRVRRSRATRIPSRSSTADLEKSPIATSSPRFREAAQLYGLVTQPLTVEMRSSETTVPAISSSSCSGRPSSSQMVAEMRLESGFSWSNSSWDLPDELLENVLQGHHSGRSARIHPRQGRNEASVRGTIGGVSPTGPTRGHR